MNQPLLRAEAPATASPFDDQLSSRLLHQRIVVLGTEVDDAVANRICAQLLLLSAEDPRADVALYVNSPGGSISAGLAVYDTMQLIPNDVATVGFGLAASMGQFLLAAGTPGKRYVLPHTRVLMHQPSGGIGGTVADVTIQAENMLHTKRVVTELNARHTGQTKETIARDSDRDRWFTAEEAVEYGFVDRIVDQVEDVRPTAGRRAGL
ncbi:ClpP family protease [Antribacter gilvus]|uniref:ClpP family protease n=1 Tax=Antribacter gilvus TaxID=2304675 RepID=UPI000F7A2EDA|nr:ATP-dependent Clp protease proteolytic subunit [Antribacter gilvus]